MGHIVLVDSFEVDSVVISNEYSTQIGTIMGTVTQIRTVRAKRHKIQINHRIVTNRPGTLRSNDPF
jgi:hypothetical protein